MTIRTTTQTVTFTRPFMLSSIDGVYPPGTYEVDTDEELLEGLSFPVYRRVATWIRLTSRQHGVTMFQTAPVDPAELETVLAGGAANPDPVD